MLRCVGRHGGPACAGLVLEDGAPTPGFPPWLQDIGPPRTAPLARAARARGPFSSAALASAAASASAADALHAAALRAFKSAGAMPSTMLRLMRSSAELAFEQWQPSHPLEITSQKFIASHYTQWTSAHGGGVILSVHEAHMAVLHDRY